MNKQTRKLAAIAAVALVSVGTTGCVATITYEEAQASQHRVVQTNTDRALFEERTWAYVGQSGREIALTEDCSTGEFFEQECHGSPDGSIQFRHSTGKGGVVVSASIAVNSEQYDAYCATPDIWASDYVCGLLPID